MANGTIKSGNLPDYSGITGIMASKRNGIVFINAVVIPSGSVGVWATLGTLPSEYRPKNNMYFTTVEASSFTVSPILLYPDGTVQIKPAKTGGYTYVGSIAFAN